MGVVLEACTPAVAKTHQENETPRHVRLVALTRHTACLGATCTTLVITTHGHHPARNAPATPARQGPVAPAAAAAQHQPAATGNLQPHAARATATHDGTRPPARCTPGGDTEQCRPGATGRRGPPVSLMQLDFSLLFMLATRRGVQTAVCALLLEFE